MLLLASIAVAAATVSTAAEPGGTPAKSVKPRVEHRFIAGLFRKGRAAMIAEDGHRDLPAGLHRRGSGQGTRRRKQGNTRDPSGQLRLAKTSGVCAVQE